MRECTCLPNVTMAVALLILVSAAPAVAGETGACCHYFDMGWECVELGEAGCRAWRGGSEWHGPGTSCFGFDCGIGGCCLDVGCFNFDQVTCGIVGGHWLGALYRCPGRLCTALVGACCEPLDASSFTCTERTAVTCAIAGGSFLGTGTSCEETDCTTPHACCLSDGTCIDLTIGDCRDVGGQVGAFGSDCATASCAATEAACIDAPGTLCLDLLPADIERFGGTSWGPDSSCDTFSCTGGACCLPDGSCEFFPRRSACLEAGGTPHAPFSTCDEVECTVRPLEACCLDTTCLEVSRANCSWRRGDAQGPGSSCDDVSCTAIRPGSIANGTRARRGSPLTLRRGDDDELLLAWSTSCSPDEPDFAVHEGELGDWYGHEAVLCTTEGLPEATVVPEPGARYFLVVSVTTTDEGSWGLRSDGQERPAPGTSCRGRRLLGCP